MYAEKFSLRTDAHGRLQGLPDLPPETEVELILLLPEKVEPPAKARRRPPPGLEEVGEICGDIVSPPVAEEEWEALRWSCCWPESGKSRITPRDHRIPPPQTSSLFQVLNGRLDPGYLLPSRRDSKYRRCIMTFTEVIPIITSLSHTDKFRLMHIILAELAKEEGIPLQASRSKQQDSLFGIIGVAEGDEADVARRHDEYLYVAPWYRVFL
jgi:hypothetical protein